MHYRALIKGDYINAVEFAGKKPTLTIATVSIASLEDDRGKMRDKGVIHFRETDRGWVLNRTNLECLAVLFGPETDAWVGHRVTLGAERVQFGSKTVDGIRVIGSPEIREPVKFELQLPRKKPRDVTLIPTLVSTTAKVPDVPAVA